MQTLRIITIAILVSSGSILLYSVANFEFAERYFEDTRNGLGCNKPLMNCPYPDFNEPMFYGIIGLGIFFAGVVLTVIKDRSRLAKKVLGMTSVLAGASALPSGILAYADDYNHLALIMKNCSNSPCMYPNIFTNIQFVLFYGIYGTVFLAIGVIFLVFFRNRKKI